MAVVLAAVLLVFASAALAGTTNTGSEKQTTPGITERTIWGQNQVAIYRLPTGVNHTGYMHFEVTFKPNWADFDIYLLDKDFEALNVDEGYNASFTGKEVIDWNVTSIGNKTIANPGYADEYMVGDAYYVCVVSFNDTATFNLWGYYPQIDPEAGYGWNTTNPWNFWLQSFKKSDITISGAPYGGWFDFKPTTPGPITARLQWPADVTKKTVSTDHLQTPQLTPANFEEYVYYGDDWETLIENYGFSSWYPPVYNGGTPDAWSGLQDTVTIGKSPAGARPWLWYYYIPSLYQVAADKAFGPFVDYDSLGNITGGGLKLGVQKMGYKATIMYPQNLRITSAPSSVKKGASATIKGTYAINGAWAPSGQKVYIQMKKADGSWSTVTTVKVGTNGAWSGKVKPTKKASWRASTSKSASANVTITEGTTPLNETKDVFKNNVIPAAPATAVFKVVSISSGYTVKFSVVGDAGNEFEMNEGGQQTLVIGGKSYTLKVNSVLWLDRSASKTIKVKS